MTVVITDVLAVIPVLSPSSRDGPAGGAVKVMRVERSAGVKRDHVPTVQHPRRVRALTSSKMGTTRADANGVVANLCNPKIGALFAALLPGFTPAGTSVPGLSLQLRALVRRRNQTPDGCRRRHVQPRGGLVRSLNLQRRMETFRGLVLVAFGIRFATETR
jgi:hypothetical protein